MNSNMRTCDGCNAHSVLIPSCKTK